MNQLILPVKSIDPGYCFRFGWEGVPNSSVLMNFKPLANIADSIAGNNRYCLLHYQAKPFDKRLYGIYDRRTMTYRSIPEELQPRLEGKTCHFLLTRPVQYPPEAAILFEETSYDEFFTNATN